MVSGHVHTGPVSYGHGLVTAYTISVRVLIIHFGGQQSHCVHLHGILPFSMNHAQSRVQTIFWLLKGPLLSQVLLMPVILIIFQGYCVCNWVQSLYICVCGVGRERYLRNHPAEKIHEHGRSACLRDTAPRTELWGDGIGVRESHVEATTPILAESDAGLLCRLVFAIVT